MDIQEQVIACAANAYMVDASSITPETDIRSELSPKSMQMLAFISGIENELDVSIPMGEATKMKTIAEFIAKVEELSA